MRFRSARFVARLPQATLVAWFTAGCATSDTPPPPPPPLDAACHVDDSTDGEPDACRFDQAKNQWRSHGIADYQYTLEQLCFCPRISAIVTVRGGQVDSVEPTGGGTAPQSAHTVEGLFSLIQRYAAQKPDRFAVEYHPSWGHPTSISVDQSRGTADDEMVITIKDLLPLP
jgi:hypothetical protein